MKIAYGVHGFGRGHAMRALAVLPELTKQHEVLILAGGDAYRALAPEYDVTRIPTLRYHYNRKGKLSNYLNAKRNVSMVVDAFWLGPGLEMVMNAFEDFGADVVMSDSEVFSHRAAQRLGIPRMTFDHFGLLAYCRPEMSSFDNLIRKGNAFVYRTLFGEPERVIVSAFFDAPAVREGVSVVGPVIRDEVRRETPTEGEHLLVYLSQGRHEYTPAVEQALLAQKCPVRVYGVGEQPAKQNVEFKKTANLPFIKDLASCRAVFATTGNQLCGELLYFGKPLLGMPMSCLEQRLNARQIERLGVGKQVGYGKVSAEQISEFLANSERYASNAKREFRDGKAEALEAINRFASELV